MGEIKLYRQIKCFQTDKNGNISKNNFIDPVSISASTKTENGSSIIEEPTIKKESSGVYFVQLDPNFYSSDITYFLNWFVKYFSDSPMKKLPTKFRINPNIIGQDIDIEIS